MPLSVAPEPRGKNGIASLVIRKGVDDAERCCRTRSQEVPQLRRVLSVLPHRAQRPHGPPPAFPRASARAGVPRHADRDGSLAMVAARVRVRLLLRLDRALFLREKPAGFVPAAAVQFHGRLEDVLADADGKNSAVMQRREGAMDARTSRYHEVYGRAQSDPEGFWAEAAQAIDWYEAPKKIFDPNAGV